LTIEDINLFYSTKYIKEALNQQEYIDDQSNTNNINNGLTENNPLCIKCCISVGLLLQVIHLNTIYFLIYIYR